MPNHQNLLIRPPITLRHQLEIEVPEQPRQDKTHLHYHEMLIHAVPRTDAEGLTMGIVIVSGDQVVGRVRV
jgi:hypothetical protein